MITISLCMIVKNESSVLARCLDSISDLCDEIIIVDTGSTDNTKEIARRYTDRIYDFKWIDDFSAARNFSFEKASCDYIYCADADEYLDSENRRQLALLKEYMDPGIEIVQMMYNTISEDTVLNTACEYRPKLFKRLRTFTWINPVHETVRTLPVVFDSDIVITHAPQSNHAARDISIFEKTIASEGSLSEDQAKMYCTELYKSNDISLLGNAKNNLYDIALDFTPAAAALAKYYELSNDLIALNKLLHDLTAVENVIPSEVYYSLGELTGSLDYYLAAYEHAKPIVEIRCAGDYALARIIDIMKATSDPRLDTYKEYLDHWEPPKEERIS